MAPRTLALPSLEGFDSEAIRLLAVGTARRSIGDLIENVDEWGTEEAIVDSFRTVLIDRASKVTAEIQRFHRDATRPSHPNQAPLWSPRLVYLAIEDRNYPDGHRLCLARTKGLCRLKISHRSLLIHLPVEYAVHLDGHKLGKVPDFQPLSRSHEGFTAQYDGERADGLFRFLLETPAELQCFKAGSLEEDAPQRWSYSFCTAGGYINFAFGPAVTSRLILAGKQGHSVIGFVLAHPDHPLRPFIPDYFGNQAIQQRHKNYRALGHANNKLAAAISDVIDGRRFADQIATCAREAHQLVQEAVEFCAQSVDDELVALSLRLIEQYRSLPRAAKL